MPYDRTCGDVMLAYADMVEQALPLAQQTVGTFRNYCDGSSYSPLNGIRTLQDDSLADVAERAERAGRAERAKQAEQAALATNAAAMTAATPMTPERPGERPSERSIERPSGRTYQWGERVAPPVLKAA